MACCTGQTKCNETVTIGYLKGLVNGIVSVTTSKSDSYCPTYAELTGGTLVPNFVDGGTNKWASNVDGISVNGTYENTQVVKVENLRVIYTRFKSITASASPTSLSECGGSTTLGYEFKLTKNTKGISDCSTGGTDTATEEGSDTASTVTYSSTQSWLTINGSTATAPKIGTVSAATRSTNVTASVTYRGSVHTSNAITISQAALTGAYETTGTSTATGIDVTYTPTTRTFGCEGGTYTVEAVGKYYTRYKWKDSCGTVYNEVYNDVQGSSNLQTKTGTFAKVLCPTTSSTSSSTASYSWSGITTSVTFTQNCSQSCEECEDYIAWGSGNGTATAPCEGGNVQVSANVSGVKHTKDYDGGVCQETGTATTSQTQSVTVVIPKNNTDTGKTYTGSETTSQGGTINYTITQPGGCTECTGGTTSYQWQNKTVSASSCDTSANVTLDGTMTRTYDNCSSVICAVTTSTTVSFTQNDTSSPKTYTFTYENATITVNQAAGPCNCLNPTYAYKFDDITVSCDSATSVTQSAKYTKYTNYSNCPTVSESGRTNVTIPAVSCNSGSSRVIQAGSSASTLASATPKITQDGGCECTIPVTCFCSGLTLSTSSVNWSYSSTTQQSVTVTKNACIGTVNVTSNNVHFTASISGTNIRIQPANTNTGTTDITGVVTVSYTADTTPCTKTINLTQGNSGSCNCASVVFTEKTTTIGSAATPSSGVVIASASFGDCSGSLGSASVDASATSWLTASTSGTNVIIKASANTDLSNDRSGVVTVTYKANSFDSAYNCSSSFTVTQLSVPCDCTSIDKFIRPIKTEFSSGGTHGEMILIASGNTRGCGTLSAKTSADWFLDEYGNSGSSIITKDVEGNPSEALFYLNVAPYGDWPSGGRNARSEIYFIPKGSDVPSCSGNSFTITQYDDRRVFASCEEIDVKVKEYELSCDSQYTVARFDIEAKYPDVFTYDYDNMRYWISASTSDDWVALSPQSQYHSDTLTVGCTVNLTGLPRTGTVNFNIVKYNIYSEEILEICQSGLTYTFTQDGCTYEKDCSGCSTYYIDTYALENVLSNTPPSGISINLYEYIGGYSFCLPISPESHSDLSFDVTIPSSAESFITYDVQNSVITIRSNGTSEIRDFYFTVGLESYVSNPPTQCEEAQTINGSQAGGCRCNYWETRVLPLSIDCDDERVTINYYDTDLHTSVDSSEIRKCGEIVSAITNSSAVTSVSSGTSNAYLYLSKNDTGEDRTISGTLTTQIWIEEAGQWYISCSKPFSFVQPACEVPPECDCSVTHNTWSSIVYKDGQPHIVAIYTATNSGDCISGYSAYSNSNLANVYTLQSDNVVDVYVENMMSETGCTDVIISFDMYDANGDTCYSNYDTITLNNGCQYLDSNKGTVTNFSATTQGGSSNVPVGTVTNCPVGSEQYLCYQIFGQPQSSGYFNAVNLVPSTSTPIGTSSYVDYDVYVNCNTLSEDEPVTVIIDIFVSKERDDCRNSESYNIGQITVTINP